MSEEGLTQIYTDDTDLRTSNDKCRDNGNCTNNDEIQGSFAPLRMMTKTNNDNGRARRRQKQTTATTGTDNSKGQRRGSTE